MTKELVPYTLALELKELGFDEPCIAVYEPQEIGVMLRWVEQQKVVSNKAIGYTIAPLYQQAFRFIRENYDAHHTIKNSGNNYESWIYVRGGVKWRPVTRSGYHTVTYEEAELECLKKLIEIAKIEHVRRGKL